MPLSPGIYFDLPEDEYHSDPALSRSGIKQILISPADYWETSVLNPSYRYKHKKAMDFGDMAHVMLLNPEKFESKFRVIGQPYQGNEHKKTIDVVEYGKAKTMLDALYSDEETHMLFSNGYPEVTIVWRDVNTGTLLRIRIDYLHHIAAIDYKTTRRLDDSSMGWTFADYGYDLQCALYSWGIRYAKAALLAQAEDFKVYGIVNKKWLHRFITTPRTYFRFLFQRNIPPYIFEYFDCEDEVIAQAHERIIKACEIYQQYTKAYPNEKWPLTSGKKKTITMYHIPRRFVEQAARELD